MGKQSVEQKSELIRDGRPDSDLVRRWRREQFCALGFPLSEARTLADSPADLAQARKLVAAGCPVEIALRIIA